MRTPLSWYEKVTGLFVVVMLGILAAALFAAAQKNNMFTMQRDFLVNTFVQKGYGVVVGSKVFILDAEAGVVTDVEFVTATARPKGLEDTHPIRVTMRVNGEFPKFLSSDTKAIINEKPIGGTQIDLDTNLKGLDSHREAPLANGATILSDHPESLFEKLAKIKDDVTAVKDDVLKTLKNVQDIIANVKTSTDEIARGEGTVGRVIHDPKMADDIAGTIASTRAMVEDLRATVLADVKKTTGNAVTASAEATGLVQDIRGTVKQVNKDLEPLPEMVASIGRTLKDVEVLVANVKTASGGFPEIARKTDKALEETNRTIEAAQKNFLLRGNLPERPLVRSEAEALPRGGQD